MSVLKIKDKDGKWVSIKTIKGDTGPKGDDYILTEQDKQQIADMAAEEVQTQIDEVQEEVSQLDKDIVNVDNRVTALNEKVDAGLATRLATDLENIDQAGVQKIIEIVQQNIPNAEGVEF